MITVSSEEFMYIYAEICMYTAFVCSSLPLPHCSPGLDHMAFSHKHLVMSFANDRPNKMFEVAPADCAPNSRCKKKFNLTPPSPTIEPGSTFRDRNKKFQKRTSLENPPPLDRLLLCF